MRDVVVAADGGFEEAWEPDLLGGTTVVRTDASVATWRGPLYQRAGTSAAAGAPVRLTLVPYAQWANREMGPMTVWLQRAGAGRHNS